MANNQQTSDRDRLSKVKDAVQIGTPLALVGGGLYTGHRLIKAGDRVAKAAQEHIPEIGKKIHASVDAFHQKSQSTMAAMEEAAMELGKTSHTINTHVPVISDAVSGMSPKNWFRGITSKLKNFRKFNAQYNSMNKQNTSLVELDSKLNKVLEFNATRDASGRYLAGQDHTERNGMGHLIGNTAKSTAIGGGIGAGLGAGAGAAYGHFNKNEIINATNDLIHPTVSKNNGGTASRTDTSRGARVTRRAAVMIGRNPIKASALVNGLGGGVLGAGLGALGGVAQGVSDYGKPKHRKMSAELKTLVELNSRLDDGAERNGFLNLAGSTAGGALVGGGVGAGLGAAAGGTLGHVGANGFRDMANGVFRTANQYVDQVPINALKRSAAMLRKSPRATLAKVGGGAGLAAGVGLGGLIGAVKGIGQFGQRKDS
jgi:hypothetical protein